MLKVVVEVKSNSQTFFFCFHGSTNRMILQSFHSRRALLTSPLFQHQLAHFNEVYLLSILVMVDTEMTSFMGTLSNTHKTTPIAQKFGFLRLGVSPTSQPVLSASGLVSHAKRQQMFFGSNNSSVSATYAATYLDKDKTQCPFIRMCKVEAKD